VTTTDTILHQEAVLTSGSLLFESFIFKNYFIVPVYEILTRALVIPMYILHNSEDPQYALMLKVNVLKILTVAQIFGYLVVDKPGSLIIVHSLTRW
jgi:hypothetical protein